MIFKKCVIDKPLRTYDHDISLAEPRINCVCLIKNSSFNNEFSIAAIFALVEIANTKKKLIQKIYKFRF